MMQYSGGREQRGDVLAIDFIFINSFLLQKPVLSKPRTLMHGLLLTTYLSLPRSLESLFSAFLLSLLTVTQPKSADVEETS